MVFLWMPFLEIGKMALMFPINGLWKLGWLAEWDPTLRSMHAQLRARNVTIIQTRVSEHDFSPAVRSSRHGVGMLQVGRNCAFRFVGDGISVHFC
jgi:hypothetical protein